MLKKKSDNNRLRKKAVVKIHKSAGGFHMKRPASSPGSASATQRPQCASPTPPPPPQSAPKPKKAKSVATPEDHVAANAVSSDASSAAGITALDTDPSVPAATLSSASDPLLLPKVGYEALHDPLLLPEVGYQVLLEARRSSSLGGGGDVFVGINSILSSLSSLPKVGYQALHDPLLLPNVGYKALHEARLSSLLGGGEDVGNWILSSARQEEAGKAKTLAASDASQAKLAAEREASAREAAGKEEQAQAAVKKAAAEQQQQEAAAAEQEEQQQAAAETAARTEAERSEAAAREAARKAAGKGIHGVATARGAGGIASGPLGAGFALAICWLIVSAIAVFVVAVPRSPGAIICTLPVPPPPLTRPSCPYGARRVALRCSTRSTLRARADAHPPPRRRPAPSRAARHRLRRGCLRPAAWERARAWLSSRRLSLRLSPWRRTATVLLPSRSAAAAYGRAAT